VGNERIQRLVESDAEPTELEYMVDLNSMKALALSPDTLGPISEGGDTVIVDANLQSLLPEFLRVWAFRDVIFDQRNVNTPQVYTASKLSPEHCIYGAQGFSFEQALVGAEAKGPDASIRACYSQLISLCGNSCLHLFCSHLPREQCVVPGIAMAGNCCQFLATYLVAESFPVTVALSSQLEVDG
jgi:hypothetical protein